MTSGKFKSIDIHSIFVNRDERQRKTLDKIEELAESINRIGLISPITINKDNMLIAGERRWTACKSLGWTSISVQYLEDIPENEIQIIELEENVRRVDLSWQDRVDTVREYFKLRQIDNPSFTQLACAEELGFDPATIARFLDVAEAIQNGVARVAGSDKFSTALGIVMREKDRKISSQLESIKIPATSRITETGDIVEEEIVPPKKIAPLINADFLEWSAQYRGPKFNLIHCDFPYGVGMHKSDQGAGSDFGTYADTADVYWKLLEGLRDAMDNVVHESAHLIFWFSMDYYHLTGELLKQMGWKVNPFPLIWTKSDNTGILPDPHRGPRRIYETAFFASRGDRKLATGPVQGPVANAFAFAGRGKTIHMNEKPVPMLTHFMKLCCDEYSSVLDPTCGSGNALKAATGLGAATVLGIERDQEFYTRSCDLYFNKENDDE